MKKTKVVLALACAVLLVAASVMGTLAYLTSTAEVKNTFTVGKVTITLDEAKTNVGGEPVKVTKDNDGNDVITVVDQIKDATRVTGNEYKLTPAHTYTKDPTIHVDSSSEDCYLFVKVVNGISSIEAKNVDEGYQNIETQMGNRGWKKLDAAKYPDVWVYCGEGATNTTPESVKAYTDHIVFDEFMISGEASNDQIKACENATITITAYGVQSEGFEGKTAVEVWEAAKFETGNTTSTDESKENQTEADPAE